MKLEKPEILRKKAEKALQPQEQAEAAFRESEERFRLVAAVNGMLTNDIDIATADKGRARVQPSPSLCACLFMSKDR